MITLIAQIVLLVATTLYVGVALKYELQMMQQNSYRNNRYWNWMVKNGDSSSPRRLTLYFLFLTTCTRFTPAIVHPIIALVLLILAIRELRMKYKKPVVFTRRATRLYIASWVVALICPIVMGVLTHFDMQVIIISMLASAAFSWVMILIANLLMQPIELYINRGFYNEAKKILESMPNLRIIGVTGSYGKTSTKHYLYRILSEKYNVLMTPGSYNTPMGVIRTVREMMKPYHDIFIVEMGAKQLGDIKEICDLVCPTIGIVTAVGEQHLESFKSIKNVQRTKFELIDALPADGLGVINNDFEYIANRPVDNVTVKRYAIAPGNDYHVENIDYGTVETRFTVVGEGHRVDLVTKLVGDCNLSNLMASVIVAMYLGVSEKSIRYGVSQIEQVEHRLNMKRTPGGLSIIDDAFNSNPDGARMALDVLSRIKTGKRIVITPGMIELGDKQVEYNQRLGEQMAAAADYVMVVGSYNRDAILAGLAQGGMAEDNIFIADNFVAAQARLIQIARSGDVVLYENDLPDTFK